MHGSVFQMWTSVGPCQMRVGETCAVWTRTEATCASRGPCTTSRTDPRSQPSRSRCTQTRPLDFQKHSSHLFLEAEDPWSPATPEWGPLRSASWDILLQRTAPVTVSLRRCPLVSLLKEVIRSFSKTTNTTMFSLFTLFIKLLMFFPINQYTFLVY